MKSKDVCENHICSRNWGQRLILPVLPNRKDNTKTMVSTFNTASLLFPMTIKWSSNAV